MSWLDAVGYLALACAFVAFFSATYWAACMPVAQSSNLGIRGLKRTQALQQNSLFAACEPGLRWCGMQLNRVLSRRCSEALDRRLMLAGDYLGLLPEEFLALCLAMGGFGFGLGGAFSYFCQKSLLYAFAAGLLGCVFPYSRLTSAEFERRKRVSAGLPPIVDLLALSLSAGLDFPGALRQVLEKSSNPNDPLIEEISLMLRELQVGKTRRAALSQFAERVPSEVVREFVGTVIQAEERGNPLARVLQVQAEVSRRQRSTKAEEAAAQASVKMTAPMVMMFGAILLMIAGPVFLSISVSLLAE